VRSIKPIYPKMRFGYGLKINKRIGVEMNKNCNRYALRLELLGSSSARAVKLGAGLACAGLVSLVLAGLPERANALNLYDGSQYGNNLEINLTTTLSYTGAYRVNSPSAILSGAGAANANDGDSNFRHGLVGNLFEAVPILDVRDGDYGAHFSGQFYINTVYLGTNQNNQASTLNSIYVNKSNDFTSGTRNVDGENAQLLDAFIYGQHAFGNSQSLQIKFGRQVLFWGQSLFIDDGIAGGQAPINIVTAQNLANPQLQQIYMPVAQAVVTYQPHPGLTFQGYYQFEWEHDYFQGAGSYFNSVDSIDAGGQSVIIGAQPGVGNLYLLRAKAITPPSQNGRFGLSVQGQVGSWDLGLFGLRYDSQAPDVYAAFGAASAVNTNVAKGLSTGTYYLVYPRDIWIEGASFSTNAGPANVAGEVSIRQHMPLVFPSVGVSTAANPGNANSNPLYPVGDTMDMQASTIYLSPGIPLDPGGVAFTGEVAVNHLLRVTSNRSLLPHGLNGTAATFDMALTPTYNDVLPNLDVTFPIGLSYNFLGRSTVDPAIYHGTGTFSIGVAGTYRAVWIASFTYKDYLGKPDVTYNSNADRGYVSLSLQRSF
jgi:hypothetical protein